MLRMQREMTQRELAFKTKLSQSTIANIELDAVNVSLSSLKRITKALQCKMSYLFLKAEEGFS